MGESRSVMCWIVRLMRIEAGVQRGGAAKGGIPGQGYIIQPGKSQRFCEVLCLVHRPPLHAVTSIFLVESRHCPSVTPSSWEKPCIWLAESALIRLQVEPRRMFTPKSSYFSTESRRCWRKPA